MCRPQRHCNVVWAMSGDHSNTLKKYEICANNFVKMVNTIDHKLSPRYECRYYNFECVVNENGLNLSVLFTSSVQQKQSVFRSFIHAAIKLPMHTHPRVYPITRPTIYHSCNNKSIYPCIYPIDLPIPFIYPSTKIIGLKYGTAVRQYVHTGTCTGIFLAYFK